MRLRATRLTAIANAVRKLFSPTSLFTAGEQGWVYDPSNLSFLFQDSAGTTPVTAMEQPVGLQLDTRLGAPTTLGAELVTNGDFSNGSTGWAYDAGWSFSGGSAVGNIVTGNGYLYQPGKLTVGKFYSFTFTVVSITSGSIRPIANSTIGTNVTSAGTYTQILLCSGGTSITLQGVGGFSGTIDNISVRELPGNHRYQTTSANRPVVSARVNLLTKTERFDDAVWTKSNATIASGFADINGQLLAQKLVATTTNAAHSAAQDFSALNGVKYTSLFRVKAAEYSYCRIAGQGLAFAGVPAVYFNLANGTVGAVSGPVDSYAVTSAGDGWYLVSLTTTAVASSTAGFRISAVSTANTEIFAGDGTSGIYTFGADLRPTNQGVNLPPYQRVNTSTDYDTAGFPIYIKANGSNQFMVSNAIDFTATDKMTVWAGLRKLSDVNTQMFVESSSAAEANNGAFNLITNNVSSGYKYQSVSRGSLSTWASSTDSAFSAPLTNVIAISNDISGDSIVLRVNKTQVATSSADQGTGNYGNYVSYHYARAGTSLFFNGHDYGSICRGAASSAAQITAAEGWINQRTKAY